MDKTSFSHKPSRGSQQGPSLDRQITIQDVEFLREAFALFDADRKEAITAEELGKVIIFLILNYYSTFHS